MRKRILERDRKIWGAERGTERYEEQENRREGQKDMRNGERDRKRF